MHWKAVEKNWSAFVGAILQRWPETKEEDLLALEGDRDRLMAYVAERHELTPAEADEQIITWLRGAVPAEAFTDAARDGENTQTSATQIDTGEDADTDPAKFGDDEADDSPIGRDR